MKKLQIKEGKISTSLKYKLETICTVKVNAYSPQIPKAFTEIVYHLMCISLGGRGIMGSNFCYTQPQARKFLAFSLS